MQKSNKLQQLAYLAVTAGTFTTSTTTMETMRDLPFPQFLVKADAEISASRLLVYGYGTTNTRKEYYTEIFAQLK